MPTLLHISASGSAWWVKTATGWVTTGAPRQGSACVVTDLAEETLVEIAVPRVFGSDRAHYVQRQLTTRFADSVFRLALPARRGRGGPMSWLAPPLQTLAAIDPGERVQIALQALQVPISGVWSTALLLAQLGKNSALPENLFIVLCQASGLRILFLKQRVPVLTRLITAVQTAPEQASEIIRTLRHLENTRVIERANQHYGVLLLGGAPGLGSLLAAERLDTVAPPASWGTGTHSSTPPDWNHVLFDLARKNPPGQLAPLSFRAGYLAGKLNQAVRIFGALFVVLVLVLAAARTNTSAQVQRERASVQAVSTELAAKEATADLALQAFGVSPELLRKAIAVDAQEIATAPDMAVDWVTLARVIGSVPGARLKHLQWQVVPASEMACVVGAAGLVAVAQTPAAAADTLPSAEPSRKVELQFTVLLADGTGPRLMAQQAEAISSQLRQHKGLAVLQDPARRLRQGDINTGAALTPAAADLVWCVTLPGAVALAPQTPRGQP